MDPEQWLLVIHKYLAVKCLVFFLSAVVRVLGPKRLRIIERNRSLNDL